MDSPSCCCASTHESLLTHTASTLFATALVALIMFAILLWTAAHHHVDDVDCAVSPVMTHDLCQAGYVCVERAHGRGGRCISEASYCEDLGCSPSEECRLTQVHCLYYPCPPPTPYCAPKWVTVLPNSNATNATADDDGTRSVTTVEDDTDGMEATDDSSLTNPRALSPPEDSLPLPRCPIVAAYFAQEQKIGHQNETQTVAVALRLDGSAIRLPDPPHLSLAALRESVGLDPSPPSPPIVVAVIDDGTLRDSIQIQEIYSDGVMKTSVGTAAQLAAARRQVRDPAEVEGCLPHAGAAGGIQGDQCRCPDWWTAAVPACPVVSVYYVERVHGGLDAIVRRLDGSFDRVRDGLDLPLREWYGLSPLGPPLATPAAVYHNGRGEVSVLTVAGNRVTRVGDAATATRLREELGLPDLHRIPSCRPRWTGGEPVHVPPYRPPVDDDSDDSDAGDSQPLTEHLYSCLGMALGSALLFVSAVSAWHSARWLRGTLRACTHLPDTHCNAAPSPLINRIPAVFPQGHMQVVVGEAAVGLPWAEAEAAGAMDVAQRVEAGAPLLQDEEHLALQLVDNSRRPTDE